MKKLSALLLSFVLTVTLMPIAAFADTDPDLTASNLTLIETGRVGEYRVTVDYANVGGTDVDPMVGGYNLSTVNVTEQITDYSWDIMADVSFLTAGGERLGAIAFPHTITLVDGDVVEVCIDAGDDVVESDETNNCVSETLNDGLSPDLTVTSVNLDGMNQVVYEVTNQGNEDVDASLSGVQTISVDGVVEKSYSWSSLGDTDFLTAGESSTLYTDALAEGIYTVEVCIDTTDLVAESDESNNCLSEDFTVESTGDDDDDDSTGTTMTVEAGSDQSLTLGDTLTLDTEAYVENLSGGDTPTATIDWGDDSSEDAELNISNPIYILGTHVYSAAGTYTVEICATDSQDGVELGTVCDTFIATVSEATTGDDDDDDDTTGDDDDDDDTTGDDDDDDDTTGDDDDDDSTGGSSGGSGGSNSRPSHGNPDLSVNNIYIQADGDVVANLSNEGDEDVSSSDSVRVQVTIDGELEWTQDYEQSSADTFLDEDEESDINVGELLSDEDETYEIEVCVDTRDQVEELRETNNCRTENLSIDDDAGEEDDEVTLSSRDSNADEDCDDYFYDTDGHWAESEICNLYDREVVEGRRRHYYIPNDTVTRAEFLKIALLNAGLDVESVRSGDDFTDVESEDWFYEYVTFARDLGIIEDDNGKFYPNESITRAEAMAILVRLELDGSDLDDLLDEDFDDSDIDFSDVDDNDWFAPYIVYGDQEDLIQGYDNGTFRPDNYISRAEAAEIAYNLYRNRY